MNILYLTNHLNIGGISSYVLTLGAGLRRRGHNVYVASSGGQLLSRFKELDLGFIPIPIKTKSEISPKILASMFKLCPMIKKYSINILHSNSRTTQVLGCLLARSKGIRHISTCHGFFKKRFSRMRFPCWGSKVIAISESVKEHLMDDFGVPERDIRVVHNGVDIDKHKQQNHGFKTEIKNSLGLKGGPVVGIVARLSDVKGHIYLIEAMRDILEEAPNAQLLVVGEGRMKKNLLALSRRLGIAENIFFIPSVSDTKDVLSIMDVFVMPSLKEGLGLSLMEAMACGLPVVGSDVGGIKSLIRHGNNGLLVKPADSKGLSLAISQLLKDKNKAELLGNQARAYIAQNFPQEKMVLETERVYQECLNANY